MEIYENIPIYHTTKKYSVYPNGSIHTESFEEALKRQERCRADSFDKSLTANVDIPAYAYYTGKEGYTSCVTGSPNDPIIAAQNLQVNFGMRYKSSCFDFTYQADYDILTENADYSGMTDGEKYRAVYEKYRHCYGENFLDALAISYTAPMQDDPYTELCEKFKTEIAKVCGLSGGYAETADQLRQLRREALYGEEASDEQVRRMITEKYPPAGEMTFRDLYKMTNEMEMCGVGGHVNNWIGEIFSEKGGYYGGVPAGYDMREAMLDTKVSLGHLRFMEDSYAGRLSSGISMHPDFGAVLSELIARYQKNSMTVSSEILEKTASEKADLTWLRV